MPFKIVISDPETGRSYQTEVKDPEARRLIGLKIGDKFDGVILGLSGYELQITGGSDKDGFPMRKDISGTGRTSIVLASGPGFRPRRKGERRRKRVRGAQISDAIVQINTKVVKKGEKPLDQIFPPKEEKKAS
ncbi:MAG: 30S ribosomal protein S6e [Candidatus Hadarchaeales archaeon]